MVRAPSTHKAALASLVRDSLAMKIGQGGAPSLRGLCLPSRASHLGATSLLCVLGLRVTHPLVR